MHCNVEYSALLRILLGGIPLKSTENISKKFFKSHSSKKTERGDPLVFFNNHSQNIKKIKQEPLNKKLEKSLAVQKK